MTIPPELEAQILRYYHVEKWPIGTIARQLHVHHGTVTPGAGPGRPAADRTAGHARRGSILICPSSTRPWRSFRR